MLSSTGIASPLFGLCLAAIVAGAPHRAEAAPGDAYSYSSADAGIQLDAFTSVANRKLPPGKYALTASGTVRNVNTATPASVNCQLSVPFDVSAYVNASDVSLPVATDPTSPSGGTFSISGIVSVPERAGGDAKIAVLCSSVGAEGDVSAFYTTLVAIQVEKVFLKRPAS